MAADGDESKSLSMVEGTQMGAPNLPLATDGGGGSFSNNVNVIIDPIIEELSKEISAPIDDDGGGVGVTKQREVEAGRQNDEKLEHEGVNWARELCLDPINNVDLENDMGNIQTMDKVMELGGIVNGFGKYYDPSITLSDLGSFPFPPGFGPCTSSNHVHASARVQSEKLRSHKQSDEKLLATIGGAEKRGSKTLIENSKKSKSSVCEASTRSSDDDVPLTSLVYPKYLKKGRAETPSKKQKAVKQGPNLKGRNLSRRILRLGSKTKLR
ncbi:hypothetical protein PIB30_105794 [Stylosanthes scabra]|uniref:Uncharacterized protein n=1 Tax=Stylosanthes scabra TaxID=79078 RepID=A0ABU6YZC8_9FABA|nr:hypothetical protein [Stylosanthes scabra]